MRSCLQTLLAPVLASTEEGNAVDTLFGLARDVGGGEKLELPCILGNTYLIYLSKITWI